MTGGNNDGGGLAPGRRAELIARKRAKVALLGRLPAHGADRCECARQRLLAEVDLGLWVEAEGAAAVGPSDSPPRPL